MGSFVLYSFASALNPTLLAATTIMLLLPHPKKLMFGYWVGAMLMSVASGVVLIYVLQDTGVASTTKQTLTPIEDLILGVLTLIAAALLAGGAAGRARERRAAHRTKPKKTPKWQQRLERGTASTTFLLGVVLSLPGATYLLLIDKLSKEHYSATATVAIVIVSNLIQLLVLEVPMIAFSLWPEQTPVAIESGKAWLRRNGRGFGAVALAIIGIAFVVRAATRAW
jgi:hypothetical protein